MVSTLKTFFDIELFEDRLRNGQNFEKFRNSKINSLPLTALKSILKFSSKIAKFGCEML